MEVGSGAVGNLLHNKWVWIGIGAVVLFGMMRGGNSNAADSNASVSLASQQMATAANVQLAQFTTQQNIAALGANVTNNQTFAARDVQEFAGVLATINNFNNNTTALQANFQNNQAAVQQTQIANQAMVNLEQVKGNTYLSSLPTLSQTALTMNASNNQTQLGLAQIQSNTSMYLAAQAASVAKAPYGWNWNNFANQAFNSLNVGTQTAGNTVSNVAQAYFGMF